MRGWAPGWALENPLEIVDYSPEFEAELVSMWRSSWEHATGLVDTNPLEKQIAYFNGEVRPKYRVRVALEEGRVVGFLASNRDFIAQLYLDVDHQRRGLGTRLLDLARAESDGVLRLFTLDCNEGAQRFYERQGFRVVRRGREPHWGLADIEYEWRKEEDD